MAALLLPQKATVELSTLVRILVAGVQIPGRRIPGRSGSIHRPMVQPVGLGCLHSSGDIATLRSRTP